MFECGYTQIMTMEQDPFHMYGPNGSAVATILGQAAEMTLGQIVATAKASDSTTGYLALKKSWREAGSAVQVAAGEHSRSGFLSEATDDAMDAVIQAVQKIVVSQNKSDAELSDRWRDYLAAIATSSPRTRMKAYRKVQKSLIHGIGLKAAKSVPIASGAASTAARVAVVWDLANQHGGFTPADRDLLMTPWLSVFRLPPGLAARS
jgi:hypothetical protein